MCLHILYSVTAPKSEDNAAMKKTDPKEQAVEKKGAISQRKLKIVFLLYVSVYKCFLDEQQRSWFRTSSYNKYTYIRTYGMVGSCPPPCCTILLWEVRM